jgi:hypothetical protein
LTEIFGGITTPGQGDRGPAALLDYLRTVVNADEGAEWARVAPGTVPVKVAHAHDPNARVFNERDLPALYLVRRRGRARWAAMGVLVAEDELLIRWVYPPAQQAHQVAREHMAPRVVRSIIRAIERVATPVWVHERDLADSDAFVLSRATATTAVDLIDTDLDGAVGGRGLTSPRYVTITAATSASAYVLTPIVVEGIRGYDYVVDSLTPTSIHGGWQLTGTVLFDRITRVSLPAQTLTTGALEVGHTEDEAANVRGSSILVHSGFGVLHVTGWEPGNVEIAIAGGAAGRDSTRRYEAVEITVAAMEQATTDIDALERLQTVDWSIYGATGNEGDGAVHMFDRED